MKKNLSLFISFIIFLTSSFAFAKPINLYDQPKADAKVSGTIDTETGIIPIFTPKDSTWVKVADPKNGNVGWIKESDLNASMGSNFSFRVINTGSGPHGYQILQFGGPQQLKPEQAKALFKEMELRQQALQKHMEQTMQDVFSNAHMTWPNFPVIVPVIMMPQHPGTAPKVKEPAPVKK